MKPTVLRRLLLGLALPFSLFLFGLLSQPKPVSSAILNFAVSEDADVSALAPNMNFGEANTLRLATINPGIDEYWTYLKVSVSTDVLAGGQRIRRATLRLYASDGGTDGGDMYRTTAFSEGSITWDTKPPSTGNKLSSVGTVTAGVWAEYDVTSAISGQGVYYFLLKDGNTDPVAFRASEHTGNLPHLVIETCPNTCMWLTQDEIMALPTTGTNYDYVVTAAANDTSDTSDFTTVGGDNDVYVLAQALIAARNNDATMRTNVTIAIADLTEDYVPTGTQPLAVARNTYAYVIAADIIDLPTLDLTLNDKFIDWLEELLATIFNGPGGPHSMESCAEQRPNNFQGHCAATWIAANIYLGQKAKVEEAAFVFRQWLGYRPITHSSFSYGDDSWQANQSDLVGINRLGATGLPEFNPDCTPYTSGILQNYDGIIPDDQRRSGVCQQGMDVVSSWPPPKEDYVWQALQGAVVTAQLLSRAGYPAWQWENQALKRSLDWLHNTTFNDGDLGYEAEDNDLYVPYLANFVLGTNYLETPPAASSDDGEGMSYTWWTHNP